MSEKKKPGLLGYAAVMSVITVVSKLLGLLRDVLVARNYGTNMESVAYVTASRLPTYIFDFVIGGVVTAAFIPVFNSILVKKGKQEAFHYNSSFKLYWLRSGAERATISPINPARNSITPTSTATSAR